MSKINHQLRRDEDHLSWLRLNWVIVSAIIGAIFSTVGVFIHLEDHVAEGERQRQQMHITFQQELDDKQRQIDDEKRLFERLEDRYEYHFGKQ